MMHIPIVDSDIYMGVCPGGGGGSFRRKVGDFSVLAVILKNDVP